MIKKNTKIIFEGEKEQNLPGGIPLSKGDIIHFHKNNELIDYEVTEKNIDYLEENNDQIVNITYKLKRK